MTADNLRDRLASLEAILNADTDGPDVTLDLLATLVDPESFRRRISLLLHLGREAEARTLVAQREPQPEWLEAGVRSAVLADDLVLAEALVHRSAGFGDSTGTLPLRAIAAFADAALVRHARPLSDRSPYRSRYALILQIAPLSRKLQHSLHRSQRRFWLDELLRRPLNGMP